MKPQVKIFSGKKLKIREISEKDLKSVKNFQDFINSLVGEEAKILLNKKKTLKEEREWLKEKIKAIRARKKVFLVAQDFNNRIVGTTGINLGRGREEHIGNFGITIRAGYRGIGLGKYLMGEILKSA